MAFATNQFFNDRGFLYIHTPIVTGADCEGAGEQFVVSTLLPEGEAGENGHGQSGGAGAGPPMTKSGHVDYTQVGWVLPQRSSCVHTTGINFRRPSQLSAFVAIVGTKFGGNPLEPLSVFTTVSDFLCHDGNHISLPPWEPILVDVTGTIFPCFPRRLVSVVTV